MAQANNRKSIPIVDKSFQYKYTAIIVSIVIVISAILGYFLLNSYWEMNRIMDLALASPEIGDKINEGTALTARRIRRRSIVGEKLERLAQARDRACVDFNQAIDGGLRARLRGKGHRPSVHHS